MRKLSSIGLAALLVMVFLPTMLFASGPSEKTPAPAGTQPAAVPAGKYQEAPMLAERVAKGELPPVDQRLPENPFVLEKNNPAWDGVGGFQSGKYGGAINMAVTWQTYHKLNWFAKTRGYEDFDEVLGRNQIMRYEPASSTLEPGLVESFDLSVDQKKLTLHLRKGVMWSDGHPLTADDYVFTYDDIIRNEALGRNPAGWTVAGASVKMTKIDDATLELTCANSLAGFPATLPRLFLMPKHLTAKYTPGVTPGATQEDFDTKVGTIGDLATHGPWMPVQEQEGLVVVERNPYYWKVDYEGKQLPYIDRVVMHTYENNDIIGLQLASGTLDFAARRIPSDLGVLMAKRDRGNYDIELRLNDAPPYVWFNIQAQDPSLAQLFRSKNFRQAMQYSVNQEKMGSVLYPNAWTRTWPSLIEQSAFFDASVAQKYNYYTFDLKKAAALLDEAGYKDANGDGKRDFKDGKPVEFVVDIDGTLTAHVAALEMWREDLKSIGITIFVNPVETSILWEKKRSGQAQASHLFWWNVGADPVLFLPGSWAPEPYAPGTSNHAVPNLSMDEIHKWTDQKVKFVPGRFTSELEKIGELVFQIVPLPLSATADRARLYKQLQAFMWDYPLFVAVPPADKAPLAISRKLTNLVNVGKIGITANQHDIYVEYLWYK